MKNKTTLRLIYHQEKKIFELLKEGYEEGRKYPRKGAYNLVIDILRRDINNLIITLEAKEELIKYEENKNGGYSTKIREYFNPKLLEYKPKYLEKLVETN